MIRPRSSRILPALVLLALAAGAVTFLKRADSPVESAGEPAAMATNIFGRRISPETAAELVRIEEQERAAGQSVWGPELLAQECGRTVEELWDRINRATNKLGAIAGLELEAVTLGIWDDVAKLPHDITARKSSGAGATIPGGAWRRFVDGYAGAGWQIANVEFRHQRFWTNSGGAPRASGFYFAARLTNSMTALRAVIEGDLELTWAARSEGGFAIQAADASRLAIKERSGALPFRTVLSERIEPDENTSAIDPLIVHDLDRDGRMEIILAAKNLVYRQNAAGEFKPERLCRHAPGTVFAALVADLDNDGWPDFATQTFDGLFLHRGSPGGTFESAPVKASTATEKLPYAMTMSCGDIDRDGDLDLFIGQYKEPFEGGSAPTPFFDANNGNPCYLLVNDGSGRFTDATEAAGLGGKRQRRIYSASLARLDADDAVDLAVVSDFAGIDLFRGDGAGRFRDVTESWVDERHAFGMAHSLADFDVDGRLDILMAGMTSPTVQRLDQMGLYRPGIWPDQRMRARMTHGNRLFLGRADGGFAENSLSASIARSGWSWGCGALDFDNDGFPDVYMVNGLESSASVRDYEAEYWLHDQFVAGSEDSYPALLYLQSKFTRTRGVSTSYGGYEKNRFFLNQSGTNFFEAGHLFGVAAEEDCRNLVADDLDGDGRVDLVFTTYEIWPERRQTVRVMKNVLPKTGHWIGFRFREEKPGKSPMNARVTNEYDGRKATAQLVTGDSYSSQHSGTIHFGVGAASAVERVRIDWVNGGSVEIKKPAVDRWHDVRQ